VFIMSEVPLHVGRAFPVNSLKRIYSGGLSESPTASS